MSTLVYKNLLDSQTSVRIDLIEGETVPMNTVIYSEWDNEDIIYTSSPMFDL